MSGAVISGRAEPNTGSVELPRLLHIVDSLEVGGLERLVADLVLLRGTQMTFVGCLYRIGAIGAELQRQGADVRLIGMERGTIRGFASALQLLRDLRPQIVHCHNMTAHLYGGLAGKLSGGIPLVMTKHGIGPPDKGRARWINRALGHRAQIIAVSEESRTLMSGWMKDSPRPVLYIPNGISLRAFENLPSRRETRDRLGWHQDEFIMGIVARLALTKGHYCLLQSLAQLRDIPAIRLAIIGDGQAKEIITRMAGDLGVTEQVQMMGERTDVPEILAALDLFVLPSEMEGMPVTVLEAMAAGLPVVATNVGGIPQVVDDGETGILVPPRDPGALAKAVRELAGNPELRERMGERGRRRVETNFSMEKMAAAYEAVYCRMLGLPASQSG